MPTITTSLLDYWLHTVQTYLAECHQTFFKSRLDALIQRHDLIQNQRGKERRSGFIYNGLIWRTQERPTNWFDHLLPLDPSLQADMDEILESEFAAQKDFHRIRQATMLALMPCSGNQDLRDVLPECILPAFKEDLRSLPRTRDPGYTVADNPVRAKLWEAAEERMNFHCAMRLIY